MSHIVLIEAILSAHLRVSKYEWMEEHEQNPYL